MTRHRFRRALSNDGSHGATSSLQRSPLPSYSQTGTATPPLREVYALNVTASDAALRSRLAARAREPPAEIAARVARAKAGAPRGAHVVTLVNEASVDAGTALAAAALRGELKCAISLMSSYSPSP